MSVRESNKGTSVCGNLELLVTLAVAEGLLIVCGLLSSQSFPRYNYCNKRLAAAVPAQWHIKLKEPGDECNYN